MNTNITSTNVYSIIHKNRQTYGCHHPELAPALTKNMDGEKEEGGGGKHVFKVPAPKKSLLGE
jgi:hypothetical protein